MLRISFAALLVALTGCSASDPMVTDDASVDANERCDAPRFLVYRKAGCGGSVAPTCVDPVDTGCVTIVCGCDGRVHTYDCAGAREPFTSEGSVCVDAGADASSDAAASDADAEVGVCGAGKHEAYATPGCSAAPTCLPDGPEDACASTFCGCDGKTFLGACGHSPRPFASVGACTDAGDGG